MNAVQFASQQNPFLRRNPFFKAEKFYSQPKPVLLPSEHELDFKTSTHIKELSQLNHIIHQQHAAKCSSKAVMSPFSQHASKINFTMAQKERNIVKKTINFKENPFLRKNLLPSSKQNQVPKEFKVGCYDFDESTPGISFSKTPKKIIELIDDNFASSYQAKSNKFIRDPIEGSPKKLDSLAVKQKHTDRKSRQDSQQIKSKYFASELKIKLKSQTYIEDEKNSTQKDLLEINIMPDAKCYVSRQSQDAPASVILKGKKFYLQEIHERY